MKINMSPKEFAALLAGGDTAEDAVREGRCLQPPLGCGQTIEVDRQSQTYFPHDGYKREWKISGLCASCQDKVSMSTEEGDGDDPSDMI